MMLRLKKLLIPFLTIFILTVNFWYVLDLVRGLSYIRDIRANAGLLEKYIYINFNLTIWIIICNSFYILLLSLKGFRLIPKIVHPSNN